MITILIYNKIRRLRDLGFEITIRWVLAYLGVVNNKRVDYIAIKVVRIRLIKEK